MFRKRTAGKSSDIVCGKCVRMQWMLKVIDKDVDELAALLKLLGTDIEDLIHIRKLQNRNTLVHFKIIESKIAAWIGGALVDRPKKVYRFRSLESKMVGDTEREVPCWLELNPTEFAWLLLHRIIGAGDSDFKSIVPHSCSQSGYALHYLLLEDFKKVFRKTTRPDHTRQLRMWGDYATSLRFVETDTLVKCSEGLKIEMFSIVVRLAVTPDLDLSQCKTLIEMVSKMKTIKVVETDEYVEFECLYISDKKLDPIGVSYCHWKTLQIFKDCFDSWINVEDGGSDARNCDRFTLVATSEHFEEFRDNGEQITTAAEHSAARIDGTHRTYRMALQMKLLKQQQLNPNFRFPYNAEKMVEFANKHICQTKTDSRVQWRYTEFVTQNTADFLRENTTFTYVKNGLVVDRMAGIADLHRFKFSKNCITTYKTFTMSDRPVAYSNIHKMFYLRFY